jgi:hypothetical protein
MPPRRLQVLGYRFNLETAEVPWRDKLMRL